jgi:hypothetical protein
MTPRADTARSPAVLYWMRTRDATDEQVNDDGRADGIPVRRLWQVERKRRRELQRIAAMDNAQPRRHGIYSGKEVELVPEGAKRGVVYPSCKAAARAIGISPADISGRLRKYKYRVAGFTWRIVGE